MTDGPYVFEALFVTSKSWMRLKTKFHHLADFTFIPRNFNKNMQRLVNLVRKPRETLWFCRRYATDTTFEEKFMMKGPLDPAAVDLMQKLDWKIVYSSYVENNKRPLSYVQKIIMTDICEKHKKRALYEEAMRKPFSLALKYSSAALTDDTPKEPEKPMVEVQDSLPVAIDKLNDERDTSRSVILNESKLEIFRQMRKREAELEQKIQPYPDKWMQDYETYDESVDDDLTADSEYGTPGMWSKNR